MNNSYSRSRLPVFVGFVIGFLSLVFVLTAATVSINGLIATSRQMDASHSAITASEELLRHLHQAEAAARGYTITGKPEYLEALTEAEPSVARALDQVERIG